MGNTQIYGEYININSSVPQSSFDQSQQRFCSLVICLDRVEWVMSILRLSNGGDNWEDTKFVLWARAEFITQLTHDYNL
jgi:hypothetical protein